MNLLTIRKTEDEEDEDEDLCNGENLRIPIFEKHLDIGELYDARTDFVHIGERLWEANEE